MTTQTSTLGVIIDTFLEAATLVALLATLLTATAVGIRVINATSRVRATAARTGTPIGLAAALARGTHDALIAAPRAFHRAGMARLATYNANHPAPQAATLDDILTPAEANVVTLPMSETPASPDVA